MLVLAVTNARVCCPVFMAYCISACNTLFSRFTISCSQKCSVMFKMHQIRFSPGLRPPGPYWESSRRSTKHRSRLGRGIPLPIPQPPRRLKLGETCSKDLGGLDAPVYNVRSGSWLAWANNTNEKASHYTQTGSTDPPAYGYHALKIISKNQYQKTAPLMISPTLMNVLLYLRVTLFDQSKETFNSSYYRVVPGPVRCTAMPTQPVIRGLRRQHIKFQTSNSTLRKAL